MEKLTRQVKELLENNNSLRDNDGELSYGIFIVYYDSIGLDRFILSNIPGKIPVIRRSIQKKYPELRGTRYTERQKYSNKVKQKLRQQEKPENLNKVYDFKSEAESVGFKVTSIKPKKSFFNLFGILG